MASERAPSAYDPTGIQYHTIPDFTFSNGTTLHDIKVAYRSFNQGSTNGVILIPTCFSGWINGTLTFTQAPNDALAKYHVVVAAMLGNGESSSPSNKNFFPEPGQLHYEDVIHAHYHLLTQGLGVKHLEAVAGFSMGGQQAYHWPIMYPQFVKRAVGICTSARTSPHNYTFLEGPIAALENSIDYIAWKQVNAKQARGETVGEQLSQLKPKRGLIAFGRTYAAWLTSAEWFRAQRWKQVGSVKLNEWLDKKGEEKLDWDADDLLVLARMWQMGDIGKTANGQFQGQNWNNNDNNNNNNDDEDLKKALASISCPVLLMPNRTDQYFRPSESEFEMKYLQRGRLEVIESDWGHTSGGGACEDDVTFMNSKLKDFLNG